MTVSQLKESVDNAYANAASKQVMLHLIDAQGNVVERVISSMELDLGGTYLFPQSPFVPHDAKLVIKVNV